MPSTLASKGRLCNGKDGPALKNILPRKSLLAEAALSSRSRTVAGPTPLFAARAMFEAEARTVSAPKAA
jgi:hypothetical protein